MLVRIDDYPAHLNACWQEHLASHNQNAPTVISTFAGCGGSSLGYSMAGFHELLATDWNEPAMQTFHLNFPGMPLLCRDIAKLSVDDLLRRTDLQPGELDVLDGSPPCQGFSTAGKRELDDPRNNLFRQYVRLLTGLQPKIFVMENVAGMVKGLMRLAFVEILRQLKAAGYQVSARLMDTMYFGVPQSRDRMIFIGVRNDLGIMPSHPKAQTVPVTVRQAIGMLPLGMPGNHEPQIIKAWSMTKPGQSSRKVCKYVGSFQSIRLDPEKPSCVQIKAHLNWHYAICRHVTIQEAARIGSFPDQFRWAGEKGRAKDQIGNSVPPLFMRAIVLHLRQNILDKIKPGQKATRETTCAKKEKASGPAARKAGRKAGK